ncbi:MAG: hypothetical protein GVY30_03270 [Chloroflexi bacterium]|jgi:hypothetical protein|nr:hypothetical protein [Chloroflexota bacterium]
MARKTRRRFPLLPYHALSRRWLWPALLMIPAGVALWWVIPSNPSLNVQYAPLAFLISIVGALIAIYTLLTRQAHVRVGKGYFTVRTPLYPVVFSFARVTLYNPSQFNEIHPPMEEKPARRRLYRKLWGKTVIVVDLKSYPLPKWWLKLWFHPYLFHPRKQALVLPVDDWMALSRSLQTHITAWRQRRR